MPFPRRVFPRKPPLGQRRCPACGLLLSLSSIEPTGKIDEDERTFECVQCAYSETVTIKHVLAFEPAQE